MLDPTKIPSRADEKAWEQFFDDVVRATETA